MPNSHPYLPNASRSFEEMLARVGVGSVEEFFRDLPPAGPLGPEGIQEGPLPEMAVERRVRGILSKSAVLRSRCFTGGGPWFHYTPSAVRHIISRGEFLTSYTPYQAEVSQGVLQALFEFQSLVCELYDMEVANASMYDLPTAVGEAALLCARVTGRRAFVIPSSLPEDRKSVIRNYTEPQGMTLREVPYGEDGCIGREELKVAVGSDVAGVYAESPSFFGTVDCRLREVVEIAHDAGALSVIGADPLSLGVFKPPGEHGADIALGDGQPLGLPPALGGNGLGLMACNGDPSIVRQMPGRIVGSTVSAEGDRGFMLALATREQHIRRERATSNICTSETLLAIAAAVYLSLLGRRGIRSVSRTILERTSYATSGLRRAGFSLPFSGLQFRDFAVGFSDAGQVNAGLSARGFAPGRGLGEFGRGLGNALLFAVTEIHTGEDIEAFIGALAGSGGG